MRYCKTCVLPDTKPGVTFNDEGICSACISTSLKHQIDWGARQEKLMEMCEEIKASNKGQYDCIVPVSGGKDSMFQLHTMKEKYKMKVLGVVVMAHLQTAEGIENINSMVSNIGIDLIKISPRHSTMKKIRKMALVKIGNPNFAEHRVVFAAVARTALFYDVPLVVWGEDIGTEFGGNVHGTSLEGSAEDLIDNDLFREASFDEFVGGTISDSELFFYHQPDKEAIKARNLKSIYLGFYHWWDGHKNYELAQTYGFTGRRAGPLSGNIIAYDNIDEKLCEVHNWLKFIKLGFWRPIDEACYQIWNGRMTREEAVFAVKDKQYEFPQEYFKEFCKYHHITESQYFKIQESLRNLDIWHKKDGDWRLKTELV